MLLDWFGPVKMNYVWSKLTNLLTESAILGTLLAEEGKPKIADSVNKVNRQKHATGIRHYSYKVFYLSWKV